MKEYRLAHISDLHFSRADDKSAERLRLQQTLDAIKDIALSLDALLITGDLNDRHDTDGYSVLKGELDALNLPYFIIMGNHDDREKLRMAFSDHCYLPQKGDLDWVVDFNGDIRFLGLDSVLPNNSAGELSDESLSFLNVQLKTDKPIIVCLHHPPVDIDFPPQDAVGLLNKASFNAIIQQSSSVAAVMCGHAHLYSTYKCGKTPVIIAPSPVNTLSLKSTDQVKRDEIGGGFLIHSISIINNETQFSTQHYNL